MTSATHEAFRSWFSDFADEQKGFAVGAAVSEGAGRPMVLVSGVRRKRSRQPVGENASWHIGSITKSFTSSLVLRLAERNLLSLETPIGSLFLADGARMHPDWQAITLRQALSHTAGIAPNISMVEFLKQTNADPREERLIKLRRLWTKPLPGKPGTFTYSNLGYVLAGAACEQVVGRSWEDIIRLEFAGLLDLPSMGIGPPTATIDPWGHRRLFGFVSAKDPEKKGSDNPAWMAPCGGLHLSLPDMIKWGEAHLAAAKGERTEFLSQESALTMRTPIEESYGLGWIIQSMSGQDASLVWHNGSNMMWYAILAMIPEWDVVLALVVNHYDAKRADPAMQSLIRDLADLRVSKAE